MIVFALMDPVLPFSESTIEAQGLDIALVVDLSSSMDEIMGVQTTGQATVKSKIAGKPYATRLEVIKLALQDFVARRKHDRLGVVVFSDNAYVISPLTFDHEELTHYIDDIDDTLLKTEGMTAIGEGIYLADQLFAKQSTTDAKNKVIVIFTDGEYNTGRDPIEALAITYAYGIRTYMVGVDLEESIKKKPNVANLIDMIKHAGGQYFQANSAGDLARANSDLQKIEKGRLAGRELTRNVPIFHWFAIPALVLILASLGLRVIPYFTDVT
jgi:Ca-activated chloride channel family protein